LRSSILLDFTTPSVGGLTKRLAVAEISINTKAKKSPIAVSVPRTAVRKFLKKFMKLYLCSQI
jgi:hypothetical protein